MNIKEPWNKGIYSDPICKVCGETEPDKFYGKMKTTCRNCHGKHMEAERVDRRQQAIDYKGGKCQKCGYDNYRGALEFHHMDPSQKDPTGLKAFSLKRLFAEVDKCMLLCANCHRETHAGL